ncbi:insulinase family protein [Halioxenophilus sp. WMMB6]|uniref:insulinase family protein n=1 Tax=Halioxenophilus sp. WMMB6 TaxID=3073815 RepID=UPI00295E9B6E|nr:insulinase family protein [Halioxenophilus sp. WMMB6]
MRAFLRLIWPLGMIVCLWLPTASWAADIYTSDVDDRQYRYFELQNGLKALVIQDANADKAAAALDVFAGSAENPEGRAGLAHFLEHMLFLGTEKYPNSDEYQAFINANGGSHNAYTALEHTNYFFDIRADALAPALDRFAQFFVAPLFTPEYVSRERNAVNSEYSARIKDDMRRNLDAMREVVNPKHPAAMFAVGSLDTLADRDGDPVREDLIEFYKRYYSSDKMALVVSGRESLDELQAMVEKLFSAVPKNDSITSRKSQPLFVKGALPMEQDIVPEQELRSLSLIFPVPLVKPYYRKKPLDYIGNLVGHEGPGSIIDILKQQGWAEALSAGGGYDDRFNSSFQVNIRLTEAGWQHRDEVVALVFAGIRKIQKSGVDAWRYQEQGQLAKLDFLYQEKHDPQQTVSFLATQLQEYPAEEAYRSLYLYEDYDRKLIRNYLADMKPDNLYLQATAPEVNADKESEYYQTPYSVASLNGKQWQAPKALVKALKLPEPNPFVPDDLTLLTGTEDQAIAKQTMDETELWFKTDTSYGVPRGMVMIRTILPSAGRSMKEAVMLSLYERMIEESLNSYTYPATLAGLNFGVNANTRGIDIQLGGYSDKQAELLQKIIASLHDTKSMAPVFERVKQQLIRDWRNADKKPPYGQLFAELASTVFSPQWSSAEKLTVVDAVTFDDVDAFAKHLFDGGRARVLVYGNFSAEDAAGFATSIHQLLNKPSDTTAPPAEVVKLDTKDDWLWLTVAHPDQALVGYLQGHEDTLAEQARMLLLQQVVSSDFFNDLRTEQQLGYVVFATNASYKQVPGLLLVVQSPVASVEAIHSAMTHFLNQFALTSEQQLDQHKQALVVDLLQAPKNLGEQAGFYWDNIIQEQWSFDRRQQLADEVNKVTLASFREFYQSRVTEGARWLWLAAGEGQDKPTAKNWIENRNKYKANSPVYVYP